MIRRLHVHNYRCLENFELSLANQPTALLVGRNGAGKSTVRKALEVLQRIGRGDTRVGTLAPQEAIAGGRKDVPLRFELDIQVAGRVYVYSVAFELPKGFKELRVYEEKLTADGEVVFHRETAKVRLVRAGRDTDATFNVDWHLVALPVLQDRGPDDPVAIVRKWLANMVLIEPVPMLIKGESRESNDKGRAPSTDLENLGDWFTNLVAGYPAAYGPLEAFLRRLMPDLRAIRNPEKAPGYRSLELEFSNATDVLTVPFADLSNGEKCYFAGALLIAAREVGGATFCFWDEPDSHWALNEAGDFTIALRKAFELSGQFIATSHNPETIRHFSLDHTFLLYRRSRLEPTQIRPLSELEISGDVVTSLILGGQVLPAANGWIRAFDALPDDHARSMRRFVKRRLILMIDFDGQLDRLADPKAEIPRDIADRVFVLGVLSEPEDLRASRKQNLEELGKTLAVECRDGVSDLWSHDLLRHNAVELARLQASVKPILFPEPL